MILDEERLRSERANRGSWKSRVTGLDEFGNDRGESSNPDPPRQKERRRPTNNNGGNEDNDLEYRLALEASKNEMEADAARRAHGPRGEETDDDLAKAIKLSKEEEDLRKRQLEDQQQENLLFDDTPEQVAQPTGFNQGYQQQAAVDWLGNPIQQPQATGYLNNAYGQPAGLQPQQTAFQNGFGYQQPQQTGYEQMQQPQQQFLQPQNTYNPWAQQAAQPIQEQPTAQPGSNNPWAANNQSNTSIQAQPTGSNNPFATARPQQQTSAFKAPTLSTLQEQKTAQNFNNRPNPIQNFSSPAPPTTTSSPYQRNPQPPPPTQDPYQAKLNQLLASGEGQDTFGNVGDLRIPAQHTAPGTFVNSAGAGSMGRLEAAKTGNNPFYGQTPQQYPAQTGPVGFGGSSNPFGARPQQQGGGQGGSLIDL